MSAKTRMDIITLQFKRGLSRAGCSEENIERISQLIKEQKINAISLYLSEDRFKIYELIISIDWNVFKKCNLETGGNIDDIGGLQENGETVEVKTYLNGLTRKAEEKRLRLSYCILFSGALRSLHPEEYYRLKKELGFEESPYGWMNSIGLDMKESIPDLQEIIIRIRDIKEFNEQELSFIKKAGEWLGLGEAIYRAFVPSYTGKSGDYIVSNKRFPIEVELTSQGEKKLVEYLGALGISSLNGPEYAYIKQGVIISLVKLEEERVFPSPQDKNLDFQTEKNTNSKLHKEASDSSILSKNNKNSKNGNITANQSSQIQRIKTAFFLNMLCTSLFVAVLVFRNFEILNLPWNYLMNGIALAFITGYAFNAVLLNKVDKSDKLTNYSLCTIYLCLIYIWIFIYNKFLSIPDNTLKLCFFYFPLLFFVLTTHLCILLLKKNTEAGVGINTLKVWRMAIYILLSITLIHGLNHNLKFIFREKAQVQNQENTANTSSNEKTIHYYHLDLPTRNDGTYDASFGPNYLDEVNSMTYSQKLDALSKEFFKRMESDPLMAAACLGYVDRKMGTKYTGELYSEMANHWVDRLNGIADSFILNNASWNSKVQAIVGLLNSASITIEDVPGGKIESFIMSQGDEHPILSDGTYTWTKELTCHYLTYKIRMQGTEINLSFLIESGFVPVLRNSE